MATHDGHRQRMRARFCKEGLDGFAPHEVLELLLFYSRPRGDVNPLAHDLLDTFGSLKSVLEARPEQLMSVNGVGEETATLISLMVPMFRRYQACILEEQQYLRNSDEVRQYCLSLLMGCRTERFYVLCLNIERRLLGQRLISEGSLAEVSTYPRIIVETALNYNARYVILGHNHPGGSIRPSAKDVETTRYIDALLSGLDIILLDHIVVAGDKTYSIMQHSGLKAEGSARAERKATPKNG